jgi:hypothetical protein
VVLIGYAALILVAALAKRSYPLGSEAARALLAQEPD